MQRFSGTNHSKTTLASTTRTLTDGQGIRSARHIDPGGHFASATAVSLDEGYDATQVPETRGMANTIPLSRGVCPSNACDNAFADSTIEACFHGIDRPPASQTNF